jgi:hypothetical protein
MLTGEENAFSAESCCGRGKIPDLVLSAEEGKAPGIYRPHL